MTQNNQGCLEDGVQKTESSSSRSTNSENRPRQSEQSTSEPAHKRPRPPPLRPSGTVPSLNSSHQAEEVVPVVKSEPHDESTLNSSQTEQHQDTSGGVMEHQQMAMYAEEEIGAMEQYEDSYVEYYGDQGHGMGNMGAGGEQTSGKDKTLFISPFLNVDYSRAIK